MSEERKTAVAAGGENAVLDEGILKCPKDVRVARNLGCLMGPLVMLLSPFAALHSRWLSGGFLVAGVCLIVLACIMRTGWNWGRILFTGLSGLASIGVFWHFFWAISVVVAGDHSDYEWWWSEVCPPAGLGLLFCLSLVYAIVLSWRSSANVWFRAVNERAKRLGIVSTARLLGCLSGLVFGLLGIAAVVGHSDSWSFWYVIWSWTNLLGGACLIAFSILIRRGMSWARIAFTALSCVVVLYDLAVMSYEMIVCEFTRDDLLAWGILLLFALLLMVALVLSWLPPVNAWFRALEEQKRADR
jgi:hypothetical protein